MDRDLGPSARARCVEGALEARDAVGIHGVGAGVELVPVLVDAQADARAPGHDHQRVAPGVSSMGWQWGVSRFTNEEGAPWRAAVELALRTSRRGQSGKRGFMSDGFERSRARPSTSRCPPAPYGDKNPGRGRRQGRSLAGAPRAMSRAPISGPSRRCRDGQASANRLQASWRSSAQSSSGAPVRSTRTAASRFPQCFSSREGWDGTTSRICSSASITCR